MSKDRTTEAPARYVTSLRDGDLGPGPLHAAKRHLIDSLGYAMGGFESEPAVIARRVAPACGGGPSARLLGEGRPTTPEAAAFASSAMIRFLDANDTYVATGSGHPSDMLDRPFAIERTKVLRRRVPCAGAAGAGAPGRRSGPTSDHSLPYMLAVALVDGRITPASFEPARYLDPGLRPLMHRIQVSENAEFSRRFPQELASEIRVRTRSGERLVARAEFPRGHVKNPMTDADVEKKFREHRNYKGSD